MKKRETSVVRSISLIISHSKSEGVERGKIDLGMVAREGLSFVWGLYFLPGVRRKRREKEYWDAPNK